MQLSDGQADNIHNIKFSVLHYFRVWYSKKVVSIFYMDRNKISRRYSQDKFFERTNKKVKLQHIILREVKGKSKEIQTLKCYSIICQKF